jgi:hypothetical protein
MLRILPAPAAVALVFYLPLHLLFVLCGVVITPFADVAAQYDKPIGPFYFGHVSTGIL